MNNYIQDYQFNRKLAAKLYRTCQKCGRAKCNQLAFLASFTSLYALAYETRFLYGEQIVTKIRSHSQCPKVTLRDKFIMYLFRHSYIIMYALGPIKPNIKLLFSS